MSVADRQVCARCGANNFATQAACWKCGAALVGGPVQSVPSSPPAALAQPPGIAHGAAAALGLLFPVLAVPVGIVFLMLDDRRRAEVGRLAILWGIGGTLLHLGATVALLYPAYRQARALVLPGGASPRLTDDVPPLRLPGIDR